MEVEITKDNFETLRNGDLPLVVDSVGHLVRPLQGNLSACVKTR